MTPIPPPPVLSNFAITSPKNNAPIVSDASGVPVTVQGTFKTSGFVANLVRLSSLSVTVQLGATDSFHGAKVTWDTFDPQSNGSGTWSYNGVTPVGGNIVVTASGVLNYETAVYETETHQTIWTPGSTAPQNQQINLLVSQVPVPTISSPIEGQVLPGDALGAPVKVQGGISLPSGVLIAAVASVQWKLGAATGPAQKGADGTWQSWSAVITVPLGVHILSFTATDQTNNTSPAITRRVQVAFPVDLFDTTPQSYFQALVEFGTNPFDSDGNPRVLTGSGPLTLTMIDSTFYRSAVLLLPVDGVYLYAAKASEAIYPARICVEVLRRYLSQNPPTTAQAQALNAAQMAYQQAAYVCMLEQIGTSYDEIRLARTYDRQDPQGLARAQALAARLGIDLGTTVDPDGSYIGDHLDRLCFAPQGTPNSATTLLFQLSATDKAGPNSSGNTATATVNVVVYGNKPSITVAAGKNQTVNPGAAVTLSASGVDSNPGAAITAYRWTQVEGPTVTINNANNAAADFVAPRPFRNDISLTFQVVVTDSLGATASSTVSVTVNAVNNPLLLSAGNSQTVQQGVGVTLSGSATDTTAGATIIYRWGQISGPGVALNNANSAVAGFTAPVAPHPIQFLNEQNLELTFGLVDTTRDPFSQAATSGDTQGVIGRWSFAGLDWNRKTDAEGVVYLDIGSTAGQPSQLTRYREKGKATVLATGTGPTPGEVTLSPVGGSGVSGRVFVNLGATALIGLSVYPRFLSWQRQHLRGVWQQQDFQFTQSAIVGDAQTQVANCTLIGVAPGKNSDAGGIIYLSLLLIAGPSYQVNLYQDAARANLVATGASSTASGRLALAAANNSGLSGTVTINYKADSSQMSILFTDPPLIDPDVLIPGDFKYPVANDPAFTLFTARQATIQGWINQFKTQAGGTLAGLNSILQSVLKDPAYYQNGMQVSDILALNTKAQGGTDISPQLTALQLPLDAFDYLALICPIVQSGIGLLDTEWDDIYSILAQVLKVRAYSAWRIAEATAQLTLGPDSFAYPPAQPALPTTGMDGSGLPVPNGDPDPRWTIVATPASTTPTPAHVTIPGSLIGGSWIANDARGQWISPHANESAGEVPGLYIYQTTLDLTGYDPASVILTLQVAVDDELRGVQLNGTDLGLTGGTFSGFTTFTIKGRLQSGINTLAFVVFNAGTTANPSGLRVEFSFANAPDLAELPPWRATLQQRQTWQNSLNARIEQDSSLVTGLHAAVDQTEQQTLTQLRDALVAACSSGASSNPTVPVSADWTGQALLIDVENTSQQKVTRLGEATVMMQSMFFGLRNGEFEQLSPAPPVSSWYLKEPLSNFDEEWYWMGSYNNWQSVMLVFLYPENLLLPSFRLDAAAGEPGSIGEKTAAFDTLVSTLGNNAPLTPGEALAVANSYVGSLNPTRFTLSAAAAAAGSNTTYTGQIVGGDGNAFLGVTFKVAGFTDAANNGFFACTSSTSTTLTLGNPGGVAESYAAAATNPGPYPGLPKELGPGFQYPDPSNVDLSNLPWTPSALVSYINAGNETAVAFLWEAWYFVPVQIALELQKAGQFEAALDWFRIVYAYDLPLSTGSDTNRKIFYGLRAENTEFAYVQIPTWLIDSTNPHQIAPTRAYAYTRSTIFMIVQCLLAFADAQFGSETAASIANARLLYLQAQELLNQVPQILPVDPVTGANPVLAGMQQLTDIRLFNLSSGRNIAGMLIPTQQTSNAALSIQPSAYRYSALMDRARQLVTLAQQVEGTYLASLAAADNEAYTALKANQDLETADATVTLSQLQLQTATDGITLAGDQVAKANDAINHYNSLINSDIVSKEHSSINFQWAAVGLQVEASGAYAGAAVVSFFTSAFGGGAGDIAASLSSAASAVSTTASILNAQASLEEKQMDWQFGLSQAQNDVAIGRQQVVIASDQQATAEQQLTISQLQSDHAKATVTFLANKFTNADLYRWISGVLGGVYAYFLQQAAAMARLAESQLAFERQQKALSVIRPSYWQPLSSAGLGSRGSRGLTGAETLLEDITTLDQYAFATDQIKLQVTKVVSLALLDPFAFQQFTETGVLRFATPMALFDRDFPGQFLRLISQVRVSVIALIPPGLGICATLANSGISRVMVRNSDETFQSELVQRDPQLIALSSPSSSTGMFPLTASSQPGLLLPFEDLGVDTSWEFTMAKAANPFDYSTIADVQISLDYTALDSPDYRLQVIQQMDQSLSADRAYSFKQQFPDAWYALNNSSQYTTPFSVQVQSAIADFPPNLLNLSIAQLLLYFIPADGASFQVQPTLQYTPAGASASAGGAAGVGLDPNAPPTYVFSTRRGNASAWIPILGGGVAGNWTLTLPNTPATAAIFQNEQIQDILFVITYRAYTPPWPS